MSKVFYIIGQLALIGAVIIGYDAFTMDVSVGSNMLDRVANLHAMHVQAVEFQIAGFLLLTSAILIVGGGIIEAVKKSGQ